jgi:hypothetical protein
MRPNQVTTPALLRNRQEDRETISVAWGRRVHGDPLDDPAVRSLIHEQWTPPSPIQPGSSEHRLWDYLDIHCDVASHPPETALILFYS